MTKRAKVLLMIAIALWGVALVYFFKPGLSTGGRDMVAETRRVNLKKFSVSVQDITPDFIKSYVKVCKKGIAAPDPLSPYVIKGGREDLNKLILTSDLSVGYIKFGGYITDKSGDKKIFLNIAGKSVLQSVNQLIDGRYMIIYVSSMGLIVLDVMKGGLYVIR